MSVEVADLVANLSGRDAGFSAVMGMAEVRMGALTNKTNIGLASITKFGVAIGILSASLLGDFISKATNFQSVTQALVNQTNLGTLGLDAMRQASLKLATQTGQDAADIAKGYMFVANHAFQGAAAQNILAAATKNAAATNGSASGNANVLAGILKEYNVSVKALAANSGLATKYMDVLHNAVANSNFTMADFVEGGKKAFAAASSFKVPISQVTAQLALLSEHGFPSARNAALNWSGMLRSLEQPSIKAREAMASLGHAAGVNLVGDIAKLKANGAFLPQFLADIGKATGGNANKLSSIMTQSSYEAALKALVQNAAQLAKIQVLTSAAQAGLKVPGLTGTNEAFAAQQKTLAGQMADFSATLNVIAINIGTVMVPALTKLMQTFEPVVGRFLAFSQVHPQIIAGILGIGTAIGAISAAALFAGPALAVLTGPIGLVAAAGAGLYEAWSHDFGGIQEITARVWGSIKPTLLQVTGLVSAVYDVLSGRDKGDAGIVYAGKWQAAFGAIITTANNVRGLVSALYDVLSGKDAGDKGAVYAGKWQTAFRDLLSVGFAVQSVIKGVWSVVVPVFQQIEQSIGTIITAFQMGGLGAAASAALDQAGLLLGKLGTWIVGTAAPAIGQQLLTWAKAFGSWAMATGWPDLRTAVGNLLGQFGNWIIGTAAPAIGNHLATWAKQFGSWVLAKGWPALQTGLTNLSTNLGKWIVDTSPPAIAAALATWGIKFGAWVMTKGWPALNKALFTLMGDFTAWIKGSAGDQIKTAALTWPGKIVAAWAAPGLLLLQIGKDIISGLIKGMEDEAGNLASSTLDLAKNSIEGIFKGHFGIKSPSTVFAQHGQNIVQGLINGIESQHGALGQAMLRLTSVVDPHGGTLSLSAPVGIGGGFSGLRGGGPVTVQHTSTITVSGMGSPAENRQFAEMIDRAQENLVKQMLNAASTSSSSAPASRPGVVTKR